MSAECKPEHWFLANDKNVRLAMRVGHTTEVDGRGPEADVPQNVLLAARSVGWKKLLSQQLAKDTLGTAYTSGNDVTALIDGEEFMGDLCQELFSLAGSKVPDGEQELDDDDDSGQPVGLIEDGSGGPDDFILITGWEFWEDRNLVARATTKLFGRSKKASTLRNTLKVAVRKGAALRVLSFDSLIPGVGQRTNTFVAAVNEFSPKSATCTKPRNFAISHHQKQVFIGRPSWKDSCAYVGGMDLAIDRWDDSQHNQKKQEDRNYGWHDIQVKVRGDAALQLWANFAERWGDAEIEKGINHLLPCPVPKPVWDHWEKREKDIGKQHVQVLRTIADAGTAEARRERFMPEGEKTVLCGLAKAISNAQCYIYIEEQFLWDCELSDLIAARMKANKELHLIIVMTAGCELPGPAGQYAFYLRHTFLKTVMHVEGDEIGAFGKTYRVYPYGLFQTETRAKKKPKAIYVHSKLIIIDDRYVAVGSANVDRRSMHIETEVTLGIVDGVTVSSKLGGKTATVCAFARNLREKLWQEHLELPDLGSHDPIEVLKKFPGVKEGWAPDSRTAKARQKGHLRCYLDVKGSIPPQDLCRLLDRSERYFVPAENQ